MTRVRGDRLRHELDPAAGRRLPDPSRGRRRWPTSSAGWRSCGSGQGVDRTGRLAPEAIERTRVALADYARADRRSRAPSGSGWWRRRRRRDAANADDFRAMVRATLGVEPEVVTGDEEARLSFTGAVRGLPATRPAPYLVVDIGGGSTEFVTGTAAPSTHAISVDIGCVRMTERHLRDRPADRGADRGGRARHHRRRSTGAATWCPAADATTLVGLAGSVTTVAAIALGLETVRPGADPPRPDQLPPRSPR